MTRRFAVWALLPVALFVLASGCKPKKPVTPDQPKMEVETRETPVTPPPAQEVTPPRDLSADDSAANKLPKDVEELNRVLRERGLIGDVYFAYNESDLTPEAQAQLSKNASWLRANPGYVALVEGHCDERGTNEYNLALGERRASTTVGYLVSLGVAAGRFQTVSFGEERPACTESAESCWSQNRRAHFIVKPQ